MRVSAFLEALGRWAGSQPDIEGIALVGSIARGAAVEDSDVDLVILTPLADRYLGEQLWLSTFGEVAESRQEDYGRVTSLRVFYNSGLEVEFGFTKPDWAQPPIDEGTLRVVTNGMKILYDPLGTIARMQREIDANVK